MKNTITIAIEGTPRSGKTTLVNDLVEKLLHYGMSVEPLGLAPGRDGRINVLSQVVQTTNNPETHAHLMKASVYLVQDELARFANDDVQFVILDQWNYHAMVLAGWLGNRKMIDFFTKETGVYEPAISVVLTADVDAILSRLGDKQPGDARETLTRILAAYSNPQMFLTSSKIVKYHTSEDDTHDVVADRIWSAICQVIPTLGKLVEQKDRYNKSKEKTEVVTPEVVTPESYAQKVVAQDEFLPEIENDSTESIETNENHQEEQNS